MYLLSLNPKEPITITVSSWTGYTPIFYAKEKGWLGKTNLNIVNTTNALDSGVFTQFKKLTKLHQGITKSLKSKLIDDYLVNYNKKL